MALTENHIQALTGSEERLQACVPRHASLRYLRRVLVLVVVPRSVTCPRTRKFAKVASLPTETPE